jgi:hypothetical protein
MYNDMELMRDLKEKHCFVAEDFDAELKAATDGKNI